MMTASPDLIWGGEGNPQGSQDKGSGGVRIEWEGILLGLGLDHEEAAKRGLGAELGCSDIK